MNESSDPLPYTQVDRAVKPKAALLAGAVGISPQHAMGSLVEFWDLCGDPRELERLAAEGKTEVLLTPPEVIVRFQLASGVKVDPSLLVSLGLLEHRGDIFRVRGMSRYFAPIAARLENRTKSRAGGLASVAARRAKYGTAQPEPAPNKRLNQGQTQVEPRSNQISTNGNSFERLFGEGSDEVKTTVEPARSSGQRTSDSGQLLKEEEATDSPSEVQKRPPPQPPADKFASASAFWAWVQFKRHEAGYVPEKPPHHQKLNSWWSEALMELNGDPDRLEEALYRWADDPFWNKQNPPMPFNGFMSQWRNFAPRKTG